MNNKMNQTFNQKVLSFYKDLLLPDVADIGLSVIHPWKDEEVKEYTGAFYNRFYHDTSKRVFIFGINPGRFGSGVTGVPFTDPIMLEEVCDIKNNLPKKRELSSSFIYECISAFGGARTFFKHFYLTATSPVGFTKNGVNFNYYNTQESMGVLRSFIIDTIQKQIDIGARRDVVIILGTGKNLKVFEKINKEHGFFAKVYALPHPRYVLQYQRKNKCKYIRLYRQTLLKSLQK